VTLTIRPEAVRLGEGENSVMARVVSTTYLGKQKTCALEASGVRLQAALPPDSAVSKGDDVNALLPAAALWPLRES
jgi:ABC-type Fe3+/spermidine/putrescine transport system ATPase subunit